MDALELAAAELTAMRAVSKSIMNNIAKLPVESRVRALTYIVDSAQKLLAAARGEGVAISRSMERMNVKIHPRCKNLRRELLNATLSPREKERG